MTNPTKSRPLLDRWIKLRLEEFGTGYAEALDRYDFVTATKLIRPFTEDLSTWYIRRSRDRFVAGDRSALQTLYDVLLKFSLTVAPTLPFSAEAIYYALTGDKNSVHLQDYPTFDSGSIEEQGNVLDGMTVARQIVSVAHQLRAELGISLRQPLSVMDLTGMVELKADDDLLEIIRDEVNVGAITFNRAKKGYKSAELATDQIVNLNPILSPELKAEGRYRELVRLLQSERKKAGLSVGQKVRLRYFTADAELAELLKARADELKKDLSLSALEKSGSENLTKVGNEPLAIGFSD